jgi:N4-gp56 family major capsid protein
MPTITGQDYPELFPKFYDAKLLAYLKENLVARQFAQRRPLPKGAGREIVFTRFEPLPPNTTPITYKPTPSEGKAFSTSQISVKVEEYGDYIDLDEFTDITSFVPLVAEAVDQLAYQAQRTLDAIAMREITTGTNVLFPNGKTSREELKSSDKITKELVRKAVAILKRNLIPPFPDGYYRCFIHPDKVNDLFTVEDLVNLQIAGAKGSPAESGVVAQFAGVKFVETTTAPTEAITNADGETITVYKTVIFGQNAYGIVEIDGTSVQMVYTNLDKLQRVKTIGWKAYFAAKRLYEPAIVRIETT